MTTESAIEILIESKRQNEIMRDNPNTFFSVSDIVSGEKNARKRIDALDIAIRVLLEQQERENPKPMTNADRIWASNEKLKEWYCKNRDCGRCDFCHSFACTLNEWLQQPAEEG